MRSSLKKSMNQRSRHCCFLFEDWPNDRDVIVANIKRIVEELTELREKSYYRGITLVSSPTYFPNKTGGGIYLVLTSSSTFANKWEQVAETIRCHACRPVFREPGVRSGQHGFENIAKVFELTPAEMTSLHLNRVSCDRLPEVVTIHPSPAPRLSLTVNVAGQGSEAQEDRGAGRIGRQRASQ